MTDENGENRRERRREDQELARWRGSIDARIEAIDRDVSELAATSKGIDRAVTQLHSQFESMQREVAEYRAEVGRAASQIDRGREDAVRDLKDSIAISRAEGQQGKLTRFQVFVGGMVALLVSVSSALISLAISGHLG